MDASDIVTSYALVNGRRTVYIPVTKRADASTLSVVEPRQEEPPEVSKRPARRREGELRIRPIALRHPRDQRADAGRRAGRGSDRPDGAAVPARLAERAVVVLNIPLALMARGGRAVVTDQTINIMTLGGLALAVGILVDEATVAIENIHTHLAGGNSLASGGAGCRPAKRPCPRLLAMLCVLAVFIPSFFMVGRGQGFVRSAVAGGGLLHGRLLLLVQHAWCRCFPCGCCAASAEAKRKRPSIRSAFRHGYARLFTRVVRLRWLVLRAFIWCLRR